jgi:hypothetical protein
VVIHVPVRLLNLPEVHAYDFPQSVHTVERPACDRSTDVEADLRVRLASLVFTGPCPVSQLFHRTSQLL